MSKPIRFLTAVVLSLSVGGVALAADPEDAIKARQGFMRVYAFNLGLLGDMAKGKSDYDAAVADNAARNLLALAKMNNGPMWPKGTDNAAGLEKKTRALPEIWTTWPKVSDRHSDLTQALEGFVPVAGKDLASLRSGMKAVGDGCKGCHKDFRAEDEEK